MPGEYIARTDATSPLHGQLHVNVYGDQQHFAYLDPAGHIQDVWYDGTDWHLQQVNGNPPTVPGEWVAETDAPPGSRNLCICSYDDPQGIQDNKETYWWTSHLTQHFLYTHDGGLHDVYYWNW